MKAVETLLPVFLMMALGIVARTRKWITPVQKDGAKKIVFSILFPVLIFNIVFASELSVSTLLIVGYVTFGFILAYLIGKAITRFTGKTYAHISPYLLTTCEGGNVALPLYVSIVGASHAINIVTFDMAGTIIAFVIVPVLVAKQSAGDMDLGDLVKKIFSNSFVLAVLFGLLLNLTGIYHMLQNSMFFEMYHNSISMITSPITAMILFSLGYDLKVDADIIKPIVKLGLGRIMTGLLIILGFFLVFPSLMQEKIFMIAVFLYFMSPTGFALPMQLAPLCKDEGDDSFMSAFISLFMIVTLSAYVLIVLFLQ